MTFIKMLNDESGASAAEYALLLAIVGSLIAASALALGNNIGEAMDGAGKKICEPVEGVQTFAKPTSRRATPPPRLNGRPPSICWRAALLSLRVISIGVV
jgi:pilus assembly protein Flp/PilA